MSTPYYAVIFTNYQSENLEGYAETATLMEKLAAEDPGYLGMEHAREQLGITISYWDSLESIARWKAQIDHQKAQDLGKSKWYKNYSVRICRVDREYHFNRELN